MRIIYDNSAVNSYLIIEGDESFENDGVDNLEINMLLNNRIDGYLPCMMRTINNKQQLLYEVSGYRTLSDSYNEREMKPEAIRSLIMSISTVLDKADEYLLCVDHIMMSPAYIFYMENGNRYGFCCNPYQKSSMKEGMKELAEYVIRRTDHQLDAGIELAYGFYSRVIEENYRFEKLIEEPEEAVFEKSEEDTFVAKSKNEVEEERPVNTAPLVFVVLTALAILLCGTLGLLFLHFG